VPDLRVMAARRWDQVEIVQFERGRGEAVWHNGWHRLALAEFDFPRAAIRVDGGRTLEGPLYRDQIMVHPAGIKTDSHHGAGRYMQVLLDPALVAASCLDLARGPAVVPDVAPAFHDPLCAEILRALADATLAAIPDRSAAAVGRLTGLAYTLTHEELRARVADFTARSYAFGEEWLRSVTKEEDLPMPAGQLVRVIHALSEGLVFQRLLTPELIPDELFHAAFAALGKK